MRNFGFHETSFFSVFTVKTENRKNPCENQIKTRENRKIGRFIGLYSP